LVGKTKDLVLKFNVILYVSLLHFDRILVFLAFALNASIENLLADQKKEFDDYVAIFGGLSIYI